MAAFENLCGNLPVFDSAVVPSSFKTLKQASMEINLYVKIP